MINFAQILGRVGKIDTRTLPQGTPVSNVSMVTTEKTMKNGEKQEKSMWHNVVLYGKLSEIVTKYVHEGDLLYVNGAMDSQKYKGQDGSDRIKFSVIAKEIKLIPKSSQKNESKYPENDELPF
jgi:single-strand DNA-binding protein